MPLHYRKFWLLLAWICLCAIFILSLISIPKVATFKVANIDKVEHLISYAVLMFLFSQCYLQTKTRFLYALAFIGMGVLLEVLQGLTPTRQFEYADMIANSSGVAVGWMLSDSYFHRIVIFMDGKFKNR